MSVVPALCMFSACALYGFMRADKLKARALCLSAMLRDFRLLCLQIEYAVMPLPVLIGHTGGWHIPCLWEQISKRLDTGSCVFDAWQQAYEQCRKENPLLSALTAEDIEMANEFFSCIGSSGMEAQKKSFVPILARMDELLNGARESSNIKSRVFKGVGVMAGLAIAILVW